MNLWRPWWNLLFLNWDFTRKLGSKSSLLNFLSLLQIINDGAIFKLESFKSSSFSLCSSSTSSSVGRENRCFRMSFCLALLGLEELVGVIRPMRTGFRMFDAQLCFLSTSLIWGSTFSLLFFTGDLRLVGDLFVSGARFWFWIWSICLASSRTMVETQCSRRWVLSR